MITPDVNEVFAAYQTNPTPEAKSEVIKALKPTINYALSVHNALDNPLARSKAQIFAAEAIDKFDPAAGAGLPTFVSSQLQQMYREMRQSRNPVKIPDRAMLDLTRLESATREFVDEHGREPDTAELADFARIPVSRIAKIRSYSRPMVSEESGLEGAMADASDDDAVRFVYEDADHTDRRIIEMKTGFGGNEVLQPKLIAKKLNLTPTQLSRRSARISMQIRKMAQDLESI